MLAIIAILFPSVVGLKIIEHFSRKFVLKDYVYYFVFLLLCSTVLNCVVSYLIFHVGFDVFSQLNLYPIYFCKYAIISTIINTLLAFISVIIKKNLNFEIEVKKNEKSVKKVVVNPKNLVKKATTNNKKNTSK